MTANYVLLERIELAASAASVTFSNLPQSGYTDLKIVYSSRGTGSYGYANVKVSFNGAPSGTAYSGKVVAGYTTGTLSQSSSGADSFIFTYSDGANSTSNTFANGEIYIPNYLSSNYKSISADSVSENNSSSAYAATQGLGAGLWSSTAAINRVDLTPYDGDNFVANSTFSIYGLAAVGTTPAIQAFASGGNTITTDGTYWYHAFTTSGTFTPNKPLSCDVLVVAGGGGGGDANGCSGGGGGAGGVLAYTSQATTTATTVTVGAGGANGYSGPGRGYSGSDSQFASLTASLGGSGGGNAGVTTLTGGSGGGQGQYASNVGLGTSGQGNNGGAASVSGSPYPSAGGGGAGAVGSDASGSGGGNGGAGINTKTGWGSFSAAFSATSLGVSGYIAGGGGGGTYYSTPGSGGSGGGGTGGIGTSVTQAVNGTAASGSGGGGGGGNPTTTAANGGSGFVIIRYPV